VWWIGIASVDQFGSFEREHGHVLASILLSTAAHHLLDVTGPQSYVARSGNEFWLLLDDWGYAALQADARRVDTEVALIDGHGFRAPHTTSRWISVGTTALDAYTDVNTALRQADESRTRARFERGGALGVFGYPTNAGEGK
jgi:GGDEF domain-containing protein